MSKHQIVLVFLLFAFYASWAQVRPNRGWIDLGDEFMVTLKFNKSETKEIDDYKFEATWGDAITHTEHNDTIGGISELKIYKGSEHIQTIKDIEDRVGFGYIDLVFYDYNMDGLMDFRIPKSFEDSYYTYYLFDPDQGKFVHREKWDDIPIQKMSQYYNMILSHPQGRKLHEKQTLYEVNGAKIIKRESIAF